MRFNPTHSCPRARTVCARAAFLLLLASACQPLSDDRSSPSSVAAAYTPGFGEIMTFQQMRHTKLWFAGEAGNWPLAGYEIDELGEGFDELLEYYPTREGSPVAPQDAIPRMVTEPLETLGRTIDQNDTAGFEQAYDALTEACNSCHQAMDFGFNVVQRPSGNPYPDQLFSPAVPEL